MIKPEFPLTIPCQIFYESPEELFKILLVLDCYDIKWVEGQDAYGYVPEEECAYLRLPHKLNMTVSYNRYPKYTIYSYKDIKHL